MTASMARASMPGGATTATYSSDWAGFSKLIIRAVAPSAGRRQRYLPLAERRQKRARGPDNGAGPSTRNISKYGVSPDEPIVSGPP